MAHTATTAAAAIVAADTVADAQQVAATLTGATLTATAALLGVHLHGRVADKRHQLVAHSIGRVLASAAIQGTAGEGLVASWRARKLAAIS